MRKHVLSWFFGCLPVTTALAAYAAEADPSRGAKAFQQCAACHSLDPGRHLTGPNLAGVVGRPAGTAVGFGRYSEALAGSELKWGQDSLDRWLADPAELVPGSSMRLRPVSDPEVRRDLIAFLEVAKSEGGGESNTTGGRVE